MIVMIMIREVIIMPMMLKMGVILLVKSVTLKKDVLLTFVCDPISV